MNELRVGLFGTSWWADAMYLPAINAFEGARVVAVCGRDPERAADFASRWNIDVVTTDPGELLSESLDAVIVATSNDSHHPLTMAALERGLPVLCEKPLALNLADAQEMAARAAEIGVATLVPFTYRYMPMMQYLKELVDSGYIGRPFHLAMRYHTGFAREAVYAWRFDAEVAGSGILGDLASHWLHVARWLFGEVIEIGATTTTLVDRPPRPDGADYEQAEDAAMVTVRFENGASGHLWTSALCHEGGAFDQSHHVDMHGADGTVYATCDWDTVQRVRGLRANESGPPSELEIPDHIWGSVRRDRVHDTYRDTFRDGGAMIGEFLAAVRDGVACEPDLAEGARVQQLLDLAARSASEDGRMLRA